MTDSDAQQASSRNNKAVVTQRRAGRQTRRREPDFDINNLDEAHNTGHHGAAARARKQHMDSSAGGRGSRIGFGVSLLALVLLIVVAVVGFFELGALQNKMAKVETSLDNMNLLSGNQFETLTLALDSADKQQSQWRTSVDHQLKLLDSEMRKLWVIAHQTNQPDIRKLESDLAALTKTSQQMAGKLQTQAKAIDDQTKTLLAIERTEAELKRSVATIDLVKSTLDEQQIRLADVPVALEALNLQLAELETQAQASAELLQQLDDYRAQVNRSVDQLTEEIRLLKGGGSQPGL